VSGDEHNMSDADIDQELIADAGPANKVSIQAWCDVVPPEGFADRAVNQVQQRRAGGKTTEGSLPGRGQLLSGALWSKKRKALVASVLAVMVAVAAIMMKPPAVSLLRGAVSTTDDRRSLLLGGRGVAVTEAGTRLDFSVDQHGAAIVDQRQGKVFYRVEHGGRFVVHTPGGVVTVTDLASKASLGSLQMGTCFQVEIEMKQSKQIVVAGVIGATLASAVVVTVYEGGVVVVHGQSKATVSAGESAVMPGPTQGEPPSSVAALTPGAVGTVPSEGAVDSNAAATLSKEQLLTRTTEQSDRITMLEAKLSKLESVIAHGVSDESQGVHPDQATLGRWAKECKIKFDYPDFGDLLPPEVSEGKRFAAADVAGATEAIKEMHARWLATVRSAYLEITGDSAAAKTLSIEAMEREIIDKGGKAEMSEIRTKIANERAGLSAPPAPGTPMSASERYMRAYAALGDDTEAALAKRLGAKRASEIRGERWDSMSTFSGCRD
jgi:hypothetical protein